MSEPKQPRQEVKPEQHLDMDGYYRLVAQFVDELESSGVELSGALTCEAQFQGDDPYVLRDKK